MGRKARAAAAREKAAAAAAPDGQPKPASSSSSSSSPSSSLASSLSRSPYLVPGAGAALLVLLAIFDGGPLGFLPPILRWPLALAGAGALWLPLAKARGVAFPRWAPWALAAAGLALVFGSYLLLKTVGLHPSDTDEHIYFYMAQRFAQRALP